MRLHKGSNQLPVIHAQEEPIFTDTSMGLQPIYNKIQQLRKQQSIKIEQEKQKEQRKIKVLEQLSKKQFTMAIDRRQDFIRRKLKGFQTFYQTKVGVQGRTSILGPKTQRDSKFFQQYTVKGPTPSNQNGFVKKRSKSENLLQFLKNTRGNKNKLKVDTPEFLYFPAKENHQECGRDTDQERQSFTPMRPVSKISKYEQSYSGTSHSKNSSNKISSGGYSQIARLSSVTSSKKSNTPGKYLRKGHRMRQTLMKQLQVDEDLDQKEQLFYMKEYDQWVPAALANYKKLQLEHFMNILVGNKKVEEKKEIQFKAIYL